MWQGKTAFGFTVYGLPVLINEFNFAVTIFHSHISARNDHAKNGKYAIIFNYNVAMYKTKRLKPNISFLKCGSFEANNVKRIMFLFTISSGCSAS